MLQVNFIMICIIHNILALVKITRIYRSVKTFECLEDNQFFSHNLMMENPKIEEENIVKGVINLFKLKKLKKKQLIRQ